MRDHPQLEPPTIDPAPQAEAYSDEPQLPLADPEKRELP